MRGIFSWFKNSSKMKRWLFLALIGVVLVSLGIAKIMTSKESISFGYAAKIIAYFVSGFTLVILGMIFLH